jgi:hypothetical protein
VKARAAWAALISVLVLAPKLQAKVTSAGQLSLDDEEVGEILRHMSYAQSGFRDRIRSVFGRSFRERRGSDGKLQDVWAISTPPQEGAHRSAKAASL